MAKDVTISVGGKNPDGTYSATIGGLDPGNPLLTSGTPAASTAMVPYQQPGMMMPYRARVGNMEIMFASEADFLKADRAFREMVGQQGVPAVGGGIPTLGGDTSTTNWLRTGAHAAEAIGGFLRDRGIRRKLDDLDDAVRNSDGAMRELDDIERTNTTLAPLIPTLRRLFNAERDATEAAISALEDELTAVDIQTGAGVAKVAADFMGDNRTGGMSSSTGTAVAVGAAGLGLGLLLSRDSRSRRRR